MCVGQLHLMKHQAKQSGDDDDEVISELFLLGT